MPHLPADQPRYLMGVGTPDDLVGGVARGVDMFDCVMPTRAGRTGRAYTARACSTCAMPASGRCGAAGRGCACLACTRHSRAYLHHLFRAQEMLGPMLLTQHNLTYYQSLMQGARAAILAHSYPTYTAAIHAGWAAGDSA